MTRTQIQLPDDVYARAREVCRKREISLAEPLHDAMWKKARGKDFAFRRLYDARTALTMTAQGVTEFATVNLKDFQGLGFRRVWNPLKN